MKKYKNYLLLIIIAMGSQAFIYFIIKNFIMNYNVINSILNVPMVNSFVYFYDSWYPFIVLNTFLVYKYNKSIFKYLIVTMMLAALLAHITFIIYPSEVIRPIIEVHNLTDWLVDFTYKGDTPAVNCLPSIHCIYCFVTSFYIIKCNKLKHKREIIILYSILIVLSTVFIKQHIVEDIFLALLYTIISVLLVNLNKKRIDTLFDKLNLN